MKFLILMLMTTLFVSCGSGGGGGSSSDNAPKDDVVDFSNRPISNYELRLTGCSGSTLTIVAFTDPGTIDEVRHDANIAIPGSGTISLNVSGKAIEWEANSISGNCSINMTLTRTFGSSTFVATDNIPSNGMSGFIQDY